METKEKSKDGLQERIPTYDERLDYWTEIVRCILTAEGDILETNRPILKDETMSKEQRVEIYCQNVAKEILRATYEPTSREGDCNLKDN